MNKGLNRKSTYFKKEVGSSGIFTANLNKNEGGFYIQLPGYETPGLYPIAFNLNFSSFNLNSTSAYGAAIRESYYCELTDDYENLRVYLKDSLVEKPAISEPTLDDKENDIIIGNIKENQGLIKDLIRSSSNGSPNISGIVGAALNADLKGTFRGKIDERNKTAEQYLIFDDLW